MKDELKTIQEWADKDGIIVLDPDGFDRTQPDVMTNKISYEEYSKGILFCTIIMPAKGVDIKVTKKKRS
jgi:hypothetical protein